MSDADKPPRPEPLWLFGEPEVAFWHRIDDGFAGRQPLPGSSPPRWLQ